MRLATADDVGVAHPDQPWETRPGTRSGRSTPWVPTSRRPPSPLHAVSGCSSRTRPARRRATAAGGGWDVARSARRACPSAASSRVRPAPQIARGRGPASGASRASRRPGACGRPGPPASFPGPSPSGRSAGPPGAPAPNRVRPRHHPLQHCDDVPCALGLIIVNRRLGVEFDWIVTAQQARRLQAPIRRT